MSLVENYDCAICTNTLRVPVKLKIFKSTTEHKCWDKNRLCLRCVRKYLEMDKKRREKYGTFKKCPLCMSPETDTNITFLKARNTYKKDKVLYKEINKLIKDGQLPMMNCECGEVFDDEFNMEHHFKEECDESICSCPQCKTKLQRKNLQEHIENEVQCDCGQFMPREWLDHHIQEECVN